MNTIEKIELRRVRDFGSTINVIFEFLRQNWKPVGRSLVYIMGPVLLLATIAAGGYVRGLLGIVSEGSSGSASELLASYFDMLPTIGLMVLAFMVSMIFMFGVIAGYVRLYNARYPEPIGVDDVWREVRHTFWRIAGTLIVATIAAALPMLVLVIPPIAGRLWWFVPIGVLLAIPASLYLYVCSAIVVPMRLEEEIGVFAALRRSMRLLKGRWWFTFWLFVVIQIILTFASVVFQIPLQIVMAMQSVGRFGTSAIALYLAGAFYTIGVYLLYSITIVTCCVQYYNLVEQKEGVAMSDRINEIGAPLDETTASL